MKLLLTSAGFRNKSIEDALVGLLGKPVAESHALYIPTAAHAMAMGPTFIYQLIRGLDTEAPLLNLDWKSVAVLELTALPTVGEQQWVPMVRDADVLLVDGGDTLYLHHWMRESGLADLFPSLTDTVYVGLSAGSVVMATSIWEKFVHWQPATGSHETLGVVDFSIFPHLNHKDMPAHATAVAEQWAAGLSVPGYAIDDETAIKVVDGDIEVVSEGDWKLYNP
ncbi:Type 1 glutamine amidotransferase-like domain-containing protein [Stackebrandtia nassauensis]|uniref:Peptidase S51 dipeptidase E n=1 Tax=Stackebrandtia nassauensis (strain DSM 44728 / CIP 108903 / NRRL B-16338 / NBRC 102104 / LLR-40K-21) TaxID=446470 RepID=D3QBN5_STANL|nr:Type 1 glutamine amidotransferase-like domain-containing protein [Stackebrandtia nassauensis]ADD42917.1 peptidase S51 dipeptidase E [Stackebrandtia nassauensis DSM 44728]